MKVLQPIEHTDMVLHDKLTNVIVTTDKKKLDIDMIHAFLSKRSYWAKEIPLKLVKKSIKHSICFGVYIGGKQVGFARVISDRATFAYIADVFVLEDYRGQGLSSILMNAIMNFPKFQSLRRWMLVTADAHFLYEKAGFRIVAKPEKFMEKHAPNMYTT